MVWVMDLLVFYLFGVCRPQTDGGTPLSAKKQKQVFDLSFWLSSGVVFFCFILKGQFGCGNGGCSSNGSEVVGGIGG